MTARPIRADLSRPENALLERIRQVSNRIRGDQSAAIIVTIEAGRITWRVSEADIEMVGETKDTLS